MLKEVVKKPVTINVGSDIQKPTVQPATPKDKEQDKELVSLYCGGRHIVSLMSASSSSSASHQLRREPMLKFFWEAFFVPKVIVF